MMNLLGPASVATLSAMRPEILAPLAIGLGCTLLAFFFGGLLLKRRPEPTQPPVSDESEQNAAEKSAERRFAQRRSGTPVEVQLAQDGVLLTFGTVVDRSVGGLCLNVDCAIEIGTLLTAKPSNATGMVPWTEVEVRSCRQEGAGWQIGCRFQRTPPWSVLMHFG